MLPAAGAFVLAALKAKSSARLAVVGEGGLAHGGQPWFWAWGV